MRDQCGLDHRIPCDARRFPFPPACTVEVDPPFPPDGRWDCAVTGFTAGGCAHPRRTPAARAVLVVRVEPSGGSPWLGAFANGAFGGAGGTFAGPGGQQLCLVADGLAYLANVARPAHGASWQGAALGGVLPQLLLAVTVVGRGR